MSPFRSKYKITNPFGSNQYHDYTQYGLKGHEGIDLIPTGTDWTVYALADGIVVRDEDNARSGSYGRYVTLWHPTLRRATQYCHLAENFVDLGESVGKGQRIGTMGATGNVSGAHLHLNLYLTDDIGIRQNKSNGYLGGIDPLPFLEADDLPPTQNIQEELNKVREERDKNWRLFTGLCDELHVEHQYDAAVAEIRKFDSLAEKLRHKDKELSEMKQKAELLEAELAQINTQHQILAENYQNSQKTILDQGNKISELSRALQSLKDDTEIPERSGIQLIIQGFVKMFGWR